MSRGIACARGAVDQLEIYWPVRHQRKVHLPLVPFRLVTSGGVAEAVLHGRRMHLQPKSKKKEGTISSDIDCTELSINPYMYGK